MAIVRFKQGQAFFSGGRDDMRALRDDQLICPLDDNTIRVNEKGQYITVNSIPVKGLPKRVNLKVFIEGATSFELLPNTYMDDDWAKYCKEPRDPSAVITPATPFVRSPVAAAAVGSDYEAPVNIDELNGDDDDEIKARIAARFELLEKLTRYCGEGKINSLVVSGPPGVGKTHKITNTLGVMTVGENSEPVRFGVVGGKVTPGALYELFYTYRNKGDVLVLDDVNVFETEQSLDWLKQATAEEDVRMMHRKRSADAFGVSGEIPDEFEFEGAVIFISNKDFDNPKSFPEKLQPHVQALLSRTYPLNMAMHTMRETFLRIEQVCIDEGMLRKYDLSDEDCAEVFAFFKEHFNRFREVSIRTVQKIAKMRALEPTGWKQTAATITMRNRDAKEAGF